MQDDVAGGRSFSEHVIELDLKMADFATNFQFLWQFFHFDLCEVGLQRTIKQWLYISHEHASEVGKL